MIIIMIIIKVIRGGKKSLHISSDNADHNNDIIIIIKNDKGSRGEA
jgi:hypothetical protein